MFCRTLASLNSSTLLIYIMYALLLSGTGRFIDVAFRRISSRNDDWWLSKHDRSNGFLRCLIRPFFSLLNHSFTPSLNWQGVPERFGLSLQGSWSLGFLQLLFVWLLGTRCAKLLVQNWKHGQCIITEDTINHSEYKSMLFIGCRPRKHLPIPAAADGTTFAILAALRCAQYRQSDHEVTCQHVSITIAGHESHWMPCQSSWYWMITVEPL